MITEKPTIKRVYIDLCRNCLGEGTITLDFHIGVHECPVCLGHGRVKVKKEIKITIETL